MSQEAFELILRPERPFDLRSPYFILFHSVMMMAARQLDILKIDVPINFVFDEQGRMGAEALLSQVELHAELGYVSPHGRN
jgi:hypothetical protein